MNITIENLGPIADANLALGNLTVVCGPNNSGKTYLSYAVYSLHKFCMEQTAGSYSVRKDHPLITSALVQEMVDNGDASVAIDLDKIMKYHAVLIRRLQSHFREDLHEWFAGKREDFEGSQVNLSYDDASIRSAINGRLENIKNIEIAGTTVNYREGRLIFDGNSKITRLRGEPDQRFLHRRFVRQLDSVLFQPGLRRPFIITAERMGISLFHKDLDNSRNSLVEALQNPDKVKRAGLNRSILLENTSKYARPISDEIDFVRNLSEIVQQKSYLFEDPDKKFHRKIEGLMKARYRRTVDETYLDSMARKNRSFKIPIYRASTAARELSHLYFYLKHIAKKDDLLVLDEPESHLSSLNQIQLVRILCDCVNEGMMILLSTHSEIILKELNNMIMLGQLADNREEVDNDRRHYSCHKGISPGDVRAYYCEDTTISSCPVFKWGIDIKQINETLMNLSEDAAYLSDQVLRLDHD